MAADTRFWVQLLKLCNEVKKCEQEEEEELEEEEEEEEEEERRKKKTKKKKKNKKEEEEQQQQFCRIAFWGHAAHLMPWGVPLSWTDTGGQNPPFVPSKMVSFGVSDSYTGSGKSSVLLCKI